MSALVNYLQLHSLVYSVSIIISEHSLHSLRSLLLESDKLQISTACVRNGATVQQLLYNERFVDAQLFVEFGFTQNATTRYYSYCCYIYGFIVYYTLALPFRHLNFFCC